MRSIGAILTSTYHMKQLNPWLSSSASRVVNYILPSVCWGKMEPFKDHLNTHRCLKNFRNKPQQKQPGQVSTPIPSWIVSYHIVKALAVKNVWWIWQITVIRQVFSPIFTISITFPMEMDFNLPTKFFSAKVPTVLIYQTSFMPKFLLYGHVYSIIWLWMVYLVVCA